MQQGWKTNLNKLITNLKADADTPFINPTWFTGTRLSCRRTCIANNNYGCQACYRQFSLANYEKLKEYKETVLDKKDTGTTADIEQYENNKENT